MGTREYGILGAIPKNSAYHSCKYYDVKSQDFDVFFYRVLRFVLAGF